MGVCISQCTKFRRWLVSLQSFSTLQEGQGEHKLDYGREIPVFHLISSSKEVAGLAGSAYTSVQ